MTEPPGRSINRARIFARFVAHDFRAENASVFWEPLSLNANRQSGLNGSASKERFLGMGPSIGYERPSRASSFGFFSLVGFALFDG
jgi:hypothetical protein